MTFPKLMTFILAGALALGCTKSEKEAGHHEETNPDAHEESHAETNLLEIEKTMLRDLRITTTTVEECDCGAAVSVAGEIQADPGRYAEVGVPVAARVVRLIANPGQVVRVGAVLAEAQSSELGRARADYEAAEARLTVARTALERKRALAERIVPRREVQEAEADAAAAEAELRAAATTLRALGASSSNSGDPSRLALVAPISGTVLERNVSLGQLIDREDVAFRVGDLSTLFAVVHAFERDALRVTPGASARVTFAALPGETFTGTVAWIGSQVDVKSRTIPVRVALANPSGVLRPGMSATAWLPVGSSGKQVATVPASSLQRVRDSWVVFVPKSERTFEIRQVGRGRDVPGGVEIVSGVTAGETVVVEGAFLLKAQAEKAAGGGDEHEH